MITKITFPRNHYYGCGYPHRVARVLLIATVPWLVLSAGAKATPINYVLSGASAVLPGAPAETIMGSFTFDPATDMESNVSITLSGNSIFSGPYSQPASTHEQPDQITAGRDVFIVAQQIELVFFDPLANATDALEVVDWMDSIGEAADDETPAGFAVPVTVTTTIAEPSSLALLAAAFGWVLLFRRLSGIRVQTDSASAPAV